MWGRYKAVENCCRWARAPTEIEPMLNFSAHLAVCVVFREMASGAPEIDIVTVNQSSATRTLTCTMRPFYLEPTCPTNFMDTEDQGALPDTVLTTMDPSTPPLKDEGWTEVWDYALAETVQVCPHVSPHASRPCTYIHFYSYI